MILLYKATGETAYLTKAEQYFQNYGLNYRASQFDWDNKLAGVQVLMADITKDAKYLDHTKQFINWAMKSAKKTPKGLVWISEWGSNRHAANIAGIALLAAKQNKNTAENKVWSEWAKKQVYLMLGDHGRSYVVGFGKNPPIRPHHRSSSCALKSPTSCSFNNFNSKQGNPIVLVGALVGGPKQSGSFTDDRKDYKTNEVAIDYNAGFQTVVAGLVEMVDSGIISGK